MTANSKERSYRMWVSVGDETKFLSAGSLDHVIERAGVWAKLAATEMGEDGAVHFSITAGE